MQGRTWFTSANTDFSEGESPDKLCKHTASATSSGRVATKLDSLFCSACLYSCRACYERHHQEAHRYKRGPPCQQAHRQLLATPWYLQSSH